MSKWKAEKEISEVREEITKQEMDDLEIKIKNYPQTRRTGKLLSPFDLYLESIGVIRFDETGKIVCRDTNEHRRLSKINAKLESRQYYQQEADFKRFPEEREKYNQKLERFWTTNRKVGDNVVLRCSDCKCLLQRSYVCRHNCPKCKINDPV